MAHFNKAIRNLPRNTCACKCILKPAQQSHVKVQFYSDKFNINKITRSNIENGSLDGVKKSVKRTIKSTKVPPSTAVPVPECFTSLLDIPLSSDKELDKVKLEEFKQVIEEMNIQHLPSVSTVINKTAPKKQIEVLEAWKKRKTEELGGEEQFQEYQRETLDSGFSFHKSIELSLKGEKDIGIKPGNEGFWKSVKPALDDVSDVKVIEEPCVHPDVFYQGKVDCVAQMRGNMRLIEWKTSSKLKPLLSGTYDNPLQVVAYMGAMNRSGILRQYDVPNLTNGALVFAYPSGEPASVHLMSNKICEKYWQQWLTRLYSYWAIEYQNSLNK